MNKRILSIILSFTIISLLIVFKTQGRTDQDDPKSKHAKIIKNIGVLLEEAHFSPKKIDDQFSKLMLNKFIEELDDEKSIFIQSDLDGFKKFSTQLDDEIHGKELQSFYAVNEVYLSRLQEVSMLYSTWLSTSFDFSADEKIQLDPEKINYPKSKAERVDRWRKKMKYAVLSKFIDLQESQAKNKGNKDYIFKADTVLEREARDQVRKQMDRYFTTKKSRETMEENFSTFINAMTSLMDPHTNYFPPVDLRSFNESMSGRFYGIGAQLKESDGKIIITSLVGGGPAWKSGELKENDEILKVGQGANEPVDVTGFAVSDAVKLIRGSEKGSEVRLTVKHLDGSIKVIVLLRDEVNTEETFAKSAIIQGAHKIGYIYLPEFYADFERPNGARCASDVAKEIDKLKAENIQGIIIDLRGNGGGSLYDVVKMAGLFIPSGPICQVKGKDENANVLPDEDPKVQYSGPLAVMVDGTSASASEIFAAAIQDYKRGLIIGSNSTFGKGTVQRTIPINGNFDYSSASNDEYGSLKLTLQKFYRINGGATQLRGVTPDIILPDRYDYLKFREKDNKNALGWDEISKAKYSMWKSSSTIIQLVPILNQEINQNSTFGNIKTNVKLLDKYTNKEYSLNLDKYKQEQQEIKKVYSALDDLVKLKDSMQITNLSSDTLKINSTIDKMEKNRQWIKGRMYDVYIQESVKALDKWIQKEE